MMPVLFIGHGSPMNAVQKNSFTEALAKAGSKLPKPKAIMVVSAHWLTKERMLLHQQSLRLFTIFMDFLKRCMR